MLVLFKTLNISTENPSEEVCLDIERYLGTWGHTKSLVPDNKALDWDKQSKYAVLRIRQSLEFRQAGRSASLLTKPLMMYYSFLNLLRAILAIRPEVTSKRHGLTCKEAPDLLDSQAVLSRGTFDDFLKAFGVKWANGTSNTLRECLSRIPETVTSFSFSNAKTEYAFGTPNISPLRVASKMSGKDGRLIFDKRFFEIDDFRANWHHYFPNLVPHCELGDEGLILKIKDISITNSYEALSKFCDEQLQHRLVFGDTPLWYAVKSFGASKPDLPRLAYYYIAIFILGSIVRYEPESLEEITGIGSDLGIFLNRFLQASDKYFPQLILNWYWKNQIYYGNI
jgi:hypothetical protein